MKLSFDQKQQKVLDVIRQRFEDKYDLDYCVDGVSIYVDNKIYRVKLIIGIQYVAADVLILSVNNTVNYTMTIDGECSYLISIQDILDNLKRQMIVYRDFISDYVHHYLENEDQDKIIVDLVEGKLYLYSKVVIVPVFDINNDENYCEILINSLTGLYPMKRFTSISYDDLTDCISFFI